jgi:hypothetical protein
VQEDPGSRKGECAPARARYDDKPDKQDDPSVWERARFVVTRGRIPVNPPPPLAPPAGTHSTRKRTHTHTCARATPSTLQTLSERVHPHACYHTRSPPPTPDINPTTAASRRVSAAARLPPARSSRGTLQLNASVRVQFSSEPPARHTHPSDHALASSNTGRRGTVWVIGDIFTDEDAGKLPSWASDRPKPEPKAAVHRSAPIHALSHHAHVRTGEGGRAG